MSTSTLESKPDKESTNSKLKLWISYLLGIVCLFGVLFWLTVRDIENKATEEIAAKTSSIRAMKIHFSWQLRDIKTALTEFSLDPALLNSIGLAFNHPHTQSEELTKAFWYTAQGRNDILQIRWIDTAGIERLRIDRDNLGKLLVTKQKDLQNKFSRYYVKEILALAARSVYFSKFDLNVERGKVVKPYQPILRVAVRLPKVTSLEQSVDPGLIIVNFDGHNLINQLRSHLSSIQQPLMLLNNKFEWLIHPDQSLNWGFMFHQPESLKTQYPEIVKRVQSNKTKTAIDNGGLWVWDWITTTSPIDLSVMYHEQWLLMLPDLDHSYRHMQTRAIGRAFSVGIPISILYTLIFLAFG
jgi:hypothetical protein